MVNYQKKIKLFFHRDALLMSLEVQVLYYLLDSTGVSIGSSPTLGWLPEGARTLVNL